jgi:hypothetical protein
VAVDVVPSLQVVGAVESAAAGAVMAIASAKLIATPGSAAAVRASRFLLIMKGHSLVIDFEFRPILIAG